MSRQHQRRLQRLADKVDRVLESDRRFFDRHKSRSHRIRRLSPVEKEMAEAVYGPGVFPWAPNHAWFTVVRQVEPGIRFRVFVRNCDDAEVDVPEDVAKSIYEEASHSSPQVEEIERRIRA
jgi:hypothetical protein